MPGLRQLGVFGVNNPTKKGASVTPANFAIAGLITQMERRFDIALPVVSPQDVQVIFGSQVYPSQYGPDVVDGYFRNLGGQPSTLYLYSAPNCATGAPGAITDTVASMAMPDLVAGGQKPITITPAWQTYAEYGTPGNRTGVKIESWASGSVGVPVQGTGTWPTGFRGVTQLAAITGTSGTSLTLNSVLDLCVGDILAIYGTAGSGPGYIFTTIVQINAQTKVITVADAFTAVKAGAVSDYCFVPGFQIKTFRKNLAGVELEVDAGLGVLWLSLNASDTTHYPPSVFAASNFINVAVNTTSTLANSGNKMPKTASSALYPDVAVPPTGATFAAATDGTAITTLGQYYRAMHAFDAIPVRMIALAETTDQPIQMGLESYCQNRVLGDNPVAIVQCAKNQTKTQLTTLGNNWQRGGEVDSVVVGHWGQKSDPFSMSTLSLPRDIPLVGHVMGIWIQSIGLKGIHFIPCTKDMGISGLVGIVGTQFPIPTDRTDLANAGINCVEFMAGYGYVLRNMFTPSTAMEFMFANGVLMRNFIKASIVSGLQTSENTPNSLGRVQNDKMATLGFLYSLWDKGSTGNVATGETFGQVQNPDGSATKPTDHFEVRADAINNPITSLNAGNRNLDVYFTYPAPAGSIKIGVGILLRG